MAVEQLDNHRRFLIMKRGKKYQDAAKLVEKTKAYDTEEAVETCKEDSCG